jgi:hypothetical protein
MRARLTVTNSPQPSFVQPRQLSPRQVRVIANAISAAEPVLTYGGKGGEDESEPGIDAREGQKQRAALNRLVIGEKR